MDIVFATETRQVMLQTGNMILVRKGSHWPADDPIVANNRSLFSTDGRYGMFYTVEPEGYDAPVETATAGPGEKRAVQRPDDDIDALRHRATALGVQVDMRWGPARLRQEISQA